jgi:hypothetical protein
LKKKQCIDAPQTANGTAANNDSLVRQLKQLLTNSYTAIESAAYEYFPDLTAPDCYQAMGRVERLLPTYKGPTDDDGVSFEKWAKQAVVREAARYVFLALAMGKYRLMLLKVIHDAMWTSAEDRARESSDLFSEVLTLIFAMAPKFLKNKSPKEASLSTRLCGLAKKHVFLYYNSKNKKRLEAVKRRIEKGQDLGVPEILSDAEIASMKNDAAVYDAGYSEVGFSLH